MNATTAQIGTFLNIGSPAVAELAGLVGFDWVLIDLEHGCATEAAVPDQLLALRGSATKGIVRVPTPSPDLIGRLLDWGADGVMIPRVESAATAEAMVQAARYAPRGRRGFSRTVRACGYGLHEAGDAPVILAQIESAIAVEHAAEIAAVEGITTLFIGPADLGFDLNARKDLRTVSDCLPVVLEAARAAGKTAGILVRNLTDLAAMKAHGFVWIAVESDLSVLREGMRRNLEAGRGPA